MPALRWDAVNVDCADPERLADFWAELLRVEVRGHTGNYVGLEPSTPGMPRLIFQRVPDARPAKNTLHLDLHVTSLALLPAAVERAVALGATAVRGYEEHGERWEVLADPEGNLFCLVAGS